MFDPLRALGRLLDRARGRIATDRNRPGRIFGSSLAGVTVTPESALGLAPVYACIARIATDLAAADLAVYERQGAQGRRVATELDLHDRLSLDPNGESSSQSLRQAVFAHALGWGNGFIEVCRAWDGTPGDLVPMDPATTEAARTRPTRTHPYGMLVYKCDGRPALFACDVLHLHPLGFDGISGYSPVALFRQGLGLTAATEGYGAKYFDGGSNHKGVFQHPATMSPQAQANFRESIRAMHGGVENAHELLILEEGMTFNATTIPPEEAQFLQTRRFQVEDIARMFNLPPWKIGAGPIPANFEDANLIYLQEVVVPWTVHAEQELNRKLLTREQRRRYQIEHSLTSYLRGNSAARAAFYQTLFSLGVLSPNQIAAAEGYNPVGEFGDEHFIPTNNFTALAQAVTGTAPPRPPATSPAPPTPPPTANDQADEPAPTGGDADAPDA
jgi:HK97 family phage portal protein